MEGQGENDELYPIAVLIDELKVRPPPSLPPPLRSALRSSPGKKQPSHQHTA